MPKIYIIGIVLVLLVGGFFFFQSTSISEETEQTDETSVVQELGDEEEAIEEGTEKESVQHVIVYSDSGYSPSELTIQVGDSVTFTNESTRNNWPATAMHPTHTVYPGSGIQKCGSGDAIFDACTALSAGEEWTFTFAPAF